MKNHEQNLKDLVRYAHEIAVACRILREMHDESAIREIAEWIRDQASEVQAVADDVQRQWLTAKWGEEIKLKGNA